MALIIHKRLSGRLCGERDLRGNTLSSWLSGLLRQAFGFSRNDVNVGKLFFFQTHLWLAFRTFGTRVIGWLLISSILASDLAYAMQGDERALHVTQRLAVDPEAERTTVVPISAAEEHLSGGLAANRGGMAAMITSPSTLTTVVVSSALGNHGQEGEVEAVVLRKSSPPNSSSSSHPSFDGHSGTPSGNDSARLGETAVLTLVSVLHQQQAHEDGFAVAVMSGKKWRSPPGSNSSTPPGNSSRGGSSTPPQDDHHQQQLLLVARAIDAFTAGETHSALATTQHAAAVTYDEDDDPEELAAAERRAAQERGLRGQGGSAWGFGPRFGRPADPHLPLATATQESVFGESRSIVRAAAVTHDEGEDDDPEELAVAEQRAALARRLRGQRGSGLGTQAQEGERDNGSVASFGSESWRSRIFPRPEGSYYAGSARGEGDDFFPYQSSSGIFDPDRVVAYGTIDDRAPPPAGA